MLGDGHDIRAILLPCPNLSEMSTAFQTEMLLRSDTRDMRDERRDSARGMLGKIYIKTASILWI
jgi:hypothetical protein